MGILLWSSTVHDVASRWCTYKFWNQVGKTFSLPRFQIGREVTRLDHSVAVCSPFTCTRSWTCFLFVVTLCMSQRFTGLRHRVYSTASHSLLCYIFFSSFRVTCNYGRLSWYIYFPYRKVEMTLSLFLLRFFILFWHFHLFSIRSKLRHRRDYGQQKAVVVV